MSKSGAGKTPGYSGTSPDVLERTFNAYSSSSHSPDFDHDLSLQSKAPQSNVIRV
jgi:hypothetical protein